MVFIVSWIDDLLIVGSNESVQETHTQLKIALIAKMWVHLVNISAARLT